MRLKTLRTVSVDIFQAGPRAGTRVNGHEYTFRFNGPAWLFPDSLCLVSKSKKSTEVIDISNGLEIRRPKEWK